MVDIKKIKQSKDIKELLEFGILNIDKPSGPTSFNVSDQVRKILGLRKTSHFGTLDPKVTGVLPIALNRACKLTGYFISHDKEYVGIMRFHEEIDQKKIEKAIKAKFLGEITQMPPVKSRVKRQNRQRTIYTFNILEQSQENPKDFIFQSRVQGGTYIRKLIDDLGKELNTGAHMLELRRINAGIFDEATSYTLYDLEQAAEEYKNGNEEKLKKMIVPAEIVCQIYKDVEIKPDNIIQIFTGKSIFKKDVLDKKEAVVGDVVGIFCEGKFIGMYELIEDFLKFAKPKFVMQPLKEGDK